MTDNAFVRRESLQDVADACREKGASGNWLPEDMGDVVRGLPSGSGGDFDALIDRSIVHAKSDTVTRVGLSAFHGAEQLVEIDFPLVTVINNNGFYNATSLTKVNLPLVETIGASAFYNATSLTTIELPSLTTINSNAFANAYSLSAVVLRGSEIPALSGTPFASTPIANDNGYIYVPDNLVAQYRAAPNWSSYPIKPISELEG